MYSVSAHGITRVFVCRSYSGTLSQRVGEQIACLSSCSFNLGAQRNPGIDWVLTPPKVFVKEGVCGLKIDSGLVDKHLARCISVVGTILVDCAVRSILACTFPCPTRALGRFSLKKLSFGIFCYSLGFERGGV